MLKRLLALFALAACVACGTMPAAGGQTPSAPQEATEAASGAASYALGSGDRVRVIVFGEEELTGEFQVDSSGTISFPLLGAIAAAGKTPRDIEQSITEGLRVRYIAQPRVSVEVLNFRPFYILGEVNAPGEYPYVDGLTVLNAVATAEGFTYRANQRFVMIRRSGSAVEERVRVDPATAVLPGDTVRVLERLF